MGIYRFFILIVGVKKLIKLIKIVCQRKHSAKKIKINIGPKNIMGQKFESKNIC